MSAGANINVDKFRFRRSFDAGFRPGMGASRPLDEGEPFVNLTDSVLSFGTGDGGFIDLLLGAAGAVTPELYLAADNPSVDTAAIVRALARSNRKLVFKPGAKYYCKSRVSPVAPVQFQNSTCMLFVALKNFRVDASGAQFYIDDAIAGDDAAHLGAATCFFAFQNDCKDCEWVGGTFYGNRTGLSPSKVNNGCWWSSVTRCAIRRTRWLGDFYRGSAFTGVYIFDSLIEEMECPSCALGWDVAYTENLTIRDSSMSGGNSIASIGFSNFVDPDTASNNVTTKDDGTPRALKGGIANRLKLYGNVIDGFGTGVKLDGVNGAKVYENEIKNCRQDVSGVFCGILVQTTDTTASAGFYTSDVEIYENRIHDNGSAATGKGAGIILSTNAHQLEKITIHHNEIYDNYFFGVAAFGLNGLAYVDIHSNDWTTRVGNPEHYLSGNRQTDLIEPALSNGLGAQLVSYRNRHGRNPVPVKAAYPGTKGDEVYDYATGNKFRCVAPNTWVYSTNTDAPVPG